MPLYEYICRECQHAFEELVFTEEEPVACPSCHSPQVEKQWSLPAAPRSETSSVPSGCDPTLPPCGAACRKLMQQS